MTDKAILPKNLLFRGTNDFDLELRKKIGFYYGRKLNGDYITSTTPNSFYAMIAGYRRGESAWYQQNNTKPVLLVINPQNYLDSIQFGGERSGNEIEIKGKIDFKDITVIDSLDKLLEICPNTRKEVINYFKKEYLSK